MSAGAGVEPRGEGGPSADALSGRLAVLEAAVANAPDGILMLGRDLRVLLVNPAFSRLFGLSVPIEGLPYEAALAAVATASGMPPAEQDSIRRLLRMAVLGGRPAEFVRPMANGRTLHIHAQGSVDLGVVLTAVDETELEQAHRRHHETLLAMRRRSRLLKAVLDQSPVGYVVLDEEQRLLMVNDRLRRIYGIGRNGLLPGMPTEQVVEVIGRHLGAEPGQIAEWFAEVDRALASGRPFMLQRRVPDGRSVEVWGAQVRGIGTLIMHQDATERVRAEEQVARASWAIEQQRAVLLGILDRSPVGYLFHDEDGNLQLVNERLRELYGMDPEDLEIGAPTPVIKAIGSRLGVDEGTVELWERQTREAVMQGDWVPVSWTLPDGRIIEARGARLPGFGALFTHDDVTERLHVQEKLMEADRLASLGRLVAGVAHEVNTPLGNGITALSVMADSIEDIRRALEGGTLRKSQFTEFLDEAAETVGIARRNLDRAAHLVRTFKQVARNQAVGERARFNLRTEISDLVTTFQHDLRLRGVEVTLDLPGDIELESYPGDLTQIVGNLIANALAHAFRRPDAGPAEEEAMPAGPGQRIAIRARRLGGEVNLAISDNGAGMEPAVMARIFEPFFTTASGNGGTGLGLSIVHNAVTGLLGGQLTVESKPGAGTTFRIVLPLVAPREAVEPASSGAE